jgi:hypothetical protein
MKILITGQQGLALALSKAYEKHSVQCVSRATGHDITTIDRWGHQFLTWDLVFNCAYDGHGQAQVLEFFFQHWQATVGRIIVTIGSRITTQPRTELDRDHMYWPYRQHKQNLQIMHDRMLSTALCDLKIINPGPFESAMSQHITGPKMAVQDLAQRICVAVTDPAVKRLDLWL